MSFERDREQMVEDQLRGRGIRDGRVLDAMTTVPRHEFVVSGENHHAYEDGPLPIGSEQTISQPYMVALMTELLDPREGERVLEIGTGSGYQTAVLAQLGAEVFTIERIPSLQSVAVERLERLGYDRVHAKLGDGCQGWPEAAPFDGIIITAAAREMPRQLLQQLKVGGRLVLPLGEAELQGLARVRKGSEGLESDYFGECRFVKLVGEYGWS